MVVLLVDVLILTEIILLGKSILLIIEFIMYVVNYDHLISLLSKSDKPGSNL